MSYIKGISETKSHALISNVVSSESPYGGDVLESALNNGLSFAANKYGVSVSEVEKIVETFQSEMRSECMCDKGFCTSCFVCTADNSTRLKFGWESS